MYVRVENVHILYVRDHYINMEQARYEVITDETDSAAYENDNKAYLPPSSLNRASHPSKICPRLFFYRQISCW